MVRLEGANGAFITMGPLADRIIQLPATTAEVTAIEELPMLGFFSLHTAARVAAIARGLDQEPILSLKSGNR